MTQEATSGAPAKCVECGEAEQHWLHESPMQGATWLDDAHHPFKPAQPAVSPSSSERFRWDRLDDALTNYDDKGFFHRYILWENGREKYVVDVPLDIEEHLATHEPVQPCSSSEQDSLAEKEAQLRADGWSLSVHYWGGREWTAQWARPDAIYIDDARATAETEHEARTRALAIAIASATRAPRGHQ